MSTTEQLEIPINMRVMTEQSLEQVKKVIDGYLQSIQRAVPDNIMGGSEVIKKIIAYAERNVTNAFEFAQRLAQVRDIQSLIRVQMEFVQAQMQAITDQSNDIRETTTKVLMGVAKTRTKTSLSS